MGGSNTMWSSGTPSPPNRYTYGKPVQGKVQASLCQPFRHIGILYRPHDAPQKETNCIEVSGQVSTAGECGCRWDNPFPGLLLMGLTLSLQTEKNGCFSTEVLLTAFNLTSSMYQKQFQVQASLVEDGTGRDRGVLLLGNGRCCWCVVLRSSPRAPKCTWHGTIGLLQRSPKAAL